MSGQLFDKYGAILQEDVDVLEACLNILTDPRDREAGHRGRPVRVLEIGMHDGGTARGIENFVKSWALALEYVGIDPDDGTSRPRYVPENGIVIIGDSADVFNRVPFGFDLVWVDGCHCMNHVMLDTIHYAPCVRPGGFMLFHDVNPRGQGSHHQYHGPDTPEFGLATDMAHEAIRFPWAPWTKFMESWPTEEGRTDCGTRAYRKGQP